MSCDFDIVWRGADKIGFTWEIPDFFSQVEEDYSVCWKFLRRFTFSEFIWQAQPTAEFCEGCSDLTIWIRPSKNTPITVFFKCGVRKSDGTLVETETGRYAFDTWNHSLLVRLEGVDIDYLRTRRADLVPSGTLTIVCSMQRLEVLSQTPDPDFPRPIEVAPSPAPKLVGTDKLVRDLGSLLAGGDGSDATVRVKGQEFPVHRIILGTRTPVFAAMFRHDMLEKTSGVVEIEDCEPDAIRIFLQYVYTGDVGHLTPEGAAGVYQLADKYQVDELKEMCLECLKGSLSVKSFCPTITLALKHGEKELTALAMDFYVRNVREIIRTVEWQTFLCENPIQANELFIKSHGDAKK